ncbi:ThuA domain-containing protein [Schlesneria sp. DSM 10557]|uniref:ThuA domain-containing protein n=1 Tax=Schlesneria sp. DSM 10557 TaxID=3044399 RepID=UPI00359F788B
MVFRWLVVCLLVLFPSASSADHSDHPIWDARIAAQPFEKSHFHQIRIPDWIQKTVGCGYTLSVMDTAARTEAVRHGVTISEMGFVDPFYAYYDSQLLKRRSPHVPTERLSQEIAEYKRLGVRILGVYPPCLQAEVYEEHPDWRRIATNTTAIPQIDMEQFPHGGMLCLLGPYGDYMIEILAEIVTRFPDVDAFSFDGLHYGGVCYCEHCRTNFRNETQSEIPDADLNNPAFRRYQHWADRRMENLVQRMQVRLKGLKPDLGLVTWTTNAGRWGHFLSIPRNMPARMNLLLDAPDQEFWLDETNRGTTIVPAFANAYIWATTNHRVAFSEPYILSHGNPYGKDSFPPHEIERRMMLALTYGASPSIAVIQPKHLQQELYAVMDQVQRRKPWLTEKQAEPWAAMVMSDNTRNFYGRSAGKVEERYMANVLGQFRAAQEEHLPVTVINDWNLNPMDLSRYRVLILPNCASLDETQTAAIDEFVREGGGLVASLDTSLFDEYGDPRSRFSLADVLGVEYLGLPEAGPAPATAELDVNFAISIGPDYWEKRKSVFDFRQETDSFLNQGKMKTYVGPDPVTFKGPAVKVKVRDPAASVIATITDKSAAGSPALPAVVTRTHGKGRVVYFAAGLDAGYYLYAYPYQRLVLAHAIQWAASAPQPVTIKAPMCVHSTVMRQRDENRNRLIVHLYSDLNTTAAHAFPNDDVPLREEVVPIHDIKVTLSPQYQISRIHLEPEGLDLKPEQTPEGVTVTVPRLDVHTMVVVELD